MTSPDHDAWFVYARTPGRITATPANLKGWAALIAAIAALIGVTLLVSRSAFSFHPLASGATLFVIIPIGVLLIFQLVIAKGRPAKGVEER